MEDILDFSLRIKDLSARSRHASLHALTEEATKTAVLLPMIQALGFDVFNLEEVTPEYIADVGIKKGEKIDFAIKIDKKIAILIEAKPISVSLGTAQYSQLYRYFGVASARLAILTNGREVWFFSDIDEKNKMDKRPFFMFDLQSYDEHQVLELARFQKSSFAMDSILEAASNLKFVKSAATFLKKQLSTPDDDFVRYVGKQIYDGTLTKSVIEQLRPAISSALDELIRNRIQDKLNVTFGQEATQAEQQAEKKAVDEIKTSDIDTTAEETFAFLVVKAIGSKVLPVERITIRDAKSYCSIFVDDNNRKPVCRFYFNSKTTKHIGLFDEQKIETRHHIAEPADIYKFAKEIEQTLSGYS
ncbi:type I restriction enzyme HsdR N-terminal domain-containing protein [Cypionkella sp.]|uniref:type I restriction enzyme HsdR N-terminal domain-containing protein n=1 Tax=Cypionkella sp. TaxID=2811411 RepID=UPI002635E9F9|nr:type I restriction enzyme HsdR N-terminal domain-containing protein [Cypionkella sp.]